MTIFRTATSNRCNVRVNALDLKMNSVLHQDMRDYQHNHKRMFYDPIITRTETLNLKVGPRLINELNIVGTNTGRLGSLTVNLVRLTHKDLAEGLCLPLSRIAI